jgi:hypothetical protein
MAATDTGRRLTEQHRLTQARIRARTIADSLALMDLLDVEDVSGTTSRWVAANERLVRQMRQASEEQAFRYLVAFKNAEIGSTDVPWRSRPLNVEQLRTSLTVTGPATIRHLSAQGVPLARAMQTASVSVAGANSRHALNGARHGMMETNRRDTTSQGWQRVTSGNPCAFCAMLASRGPVFKSGSFDASDPRFAGGTGTGQGPGDFKVHDHCNCMMQPVYRTDSRMTERAERYSEMWGEAQRTGAAEGTRNDALTNFRRLYEGR